jgi:hypothetical protein
MLLRPPVFRGKPFLGAAVIGGTWYATRRARARNAPSPQQDLAAQLTDLKAMLDAGDLTPQEFGDAKRKLLSQ